MPTSATPMPSAFLRWIASPSAKNPNASTKHVLRCPRTWYVTASHLPMTRNVEKFTATAITHVAAATTTTIRDDDPFAPDSSYKLLVVDDDDARPPPFRPTSSGNAIAAKIAAMYGDAAWSSCVESTACSLCMVLVQICDTQVVATARSETTAPKKLSRTSVTVATATPRSNTARLVLTSREKRLA